MWMLASLPVVLLAAWWAWSDRDSRDPDARP
jgi:hypothetical protein